MMRTQISILSLLFVFGAFACATEEKSATAVDDVVAAEVPRIESGKFAVSIEKDLLTLVIEGGGERGKARITERDHRPLREYSLVAEAIGHCSVLSGRDEFRIYKGTSGNNSIKITDQRFSDCYGDDVVVEETLDGKVIEWSGTEYSDDSPQHQ